MTQTQLNLVAGGFLARDTFRLCMRMTGKQQRLFDSVRWDTAFNASYEEPQDLGAWLNSLLTYQLYIYNDTLMRLARQIEAEVAA